MSNGRNAGKDVGRDLRINIDSYQLVPYPYRTRYASVHDMVLRLTDPLILILPPSPSLVVLGGTTTQ